MKKEKELKDIEEEHIKAEKEYKEQQKEKKREGDRQYYLARKEEKRFSLAEKMEEELSGKLKKLLWKIKTKYEINN